MIGQLCAIIEDDTYRLIWPASADQHPADAGHAQECRGRNVVGLDREPAKLLTATGLQGVQDVLRDLIDDAETS